MIHRYGFLRLATVSTPGILRMRKSRLTRFYRLSLRYLEDIRYSVGFKVKELQM